jgi:hypothetical protein
MNIRSITIAITIIRLALLVCAAVMLPQQILGQQKGSSSEASPIQVCELSAYSKQLELGANVQYYEDAGKSLTFENITSPDAMNSKWQIYTKQTLSFGFKRSAYWLRFALRNTAPQHNDWLFEVAFPTLDSIELYYPQADGRYTRHVMGDYLPFSEREVKYRTFLKRLDIPDTLPHVYYLRINTTSTTIMRIKS